MGSVQQVGFLVAPHFSTMALASVSEPLRAANLLSGRRLYRWSLIGLSPEPIASSSGFSLVPDHTIADDLRLDLLVVVASQRVRDVGARALYDWLRRHARHGTRLAAVSNASYLLARAGLLQGRRCTIHWGMLRTFQEEFPSLKAERALYVDDEDVLTCAGGTSAMDMMLSYIARDHGGELTRAIAENFLHGRIRPPRESQRTSVQWRFGITDARLANAVSLMEENIENPVPPRVIAQTVGMSSRQMERLFRSQLGKTPARFCLELRLRHARDILHQTSDSVQNVAHRCGFSSASHLGRVYREFFDSTPGRDRRISC